uniref:Uncharacterized protein n=1 Tax=viral metagenome TaxID=1070528 RepID=A0A6C0CJE7_9ZZZZ
MVEEHRMQEYIEQMKMNQWAGEEALRKVLDEIPKEYLCKELVTWSKVFYGWCILDNLPEEYQHILDQEVCDKFIETGCKLRSIPEKFRTKELCLKHLKYRHDGWQQYKHIPDHLKHDPDLLKAGRKNLCLPIKYELPENRNNLLEYYMTQEYVRSMGNVITLKYYDFSKNKLTRDQIKFIVTCKNDEYDNLLKGTERCKPWKTEWEWNWCRTVNFATENIRDGPLSNYATREILKKSPNYIEDIREMLVYNNLLLLGASLSIIPLKHRSFYLCHSALRKSPKNYHAVPKKFKAMFDKILAEDYHIPTTTQGKSSTMTMTTAGKSLTDKSSTTTLTTTESTSTTTTASTSTTCLTYVIIFYALFLLFMIIGVPLELDNSRPLEFIPS